MGARGSSRTTASGCVVCAVRSSRSCADCCGSWKLTSNPHPHPQVFILVAKSVAKVAAAYRSNGGDLAAALLPFQCFHHESWWTVRCVGGWVGLCGCVCGWVGLCGCVWRRLADVCAMMCVVYGGVCE